jgi:hypothetical protein
VKALFPGAVLLLGLLAGCATSEPLHVLGLVGPEPPESAPGVNLGRLIVYSADETGPASALGFDDVIHCSDYEIRGADGSPPRKIRNFATPVASTPATVELPAGTYTVNALAHGVGRVTVDVMVVRNRTTIVHLDDTARRPASSDATTVALPDGRVVGWRASVSNSQ